MPAFIGPFSFSPQPNPTTGGGGGGGADCEKLNQVATMSTYAALRGASTRNGHCPFTEEFCTPQPCDGAALVPIPVTPLPTPLPVTDYANSGYGQALPIVFGADKLKGNVIWSFSEPKYYTNADTGEQGTYNLVHFSLALCEGELVDVLRIWSGDKLIFDNTADTDVNGVVQPDAAGNLRSLQVDITDPDGPLGGLSLSDRTTKITVFRGTETQLPPKTMVNIEGDCITCAHRGVAYLFVENYVSADGSVPDFSVEVLANTAGLTPRSYFELPSPIEEFDQTRSYTCTYDPNYNTITASAIDASGTGAGLNVDGLVLINNTTFDQVRQLVIEPNYTGSLVYRPRQLCTLSNGHYLQGASFGNAHTISVINAYTGLVNDILGPGGGTLDTMAADGFAGLQDTCFSFVARGGDGMPADIFCGFSVNGGCYAFAQVDASNNTLRMLSFENAVFPNGHIVLGYPIQLTPNVQAANPTFADGITSTYGTNILCFTAGPAEQTEITVWVVSYDNSYVNADPLNPVATQIGTISLSNLFGEGLSTVIYRLMYDPGDNCVILIARGTGLGTSSQRMMKYNPYTGAVVWSVPVDFPTDGSRTWSPTEMIVSDKYAWIDYSSGRVYQINTVDGTVTMPIPSLTAENMAQAINTGTGQFYNGFENSIIYTSLTSAKEVTKIYLGRTARSAVAVSDVVATLLRRVGVSDELIGVNDLTALTLDGYTISNPNTLQGVYSELATVFSFDVIESNGQIVYKGRGAATVDTIPEEDLADVTENGWLVERFDPDFAAARKIAITYRDVGREYESNVQNFVLPKYTNLDFDADAPIELTVPIVLDASTAKSLAEILLYSKVAYETGYTFKIPTRYAHLEPGDTVTLTMSPTRDVTCRVRESSYSVADGVIEMQAVYEDPDIYTDQVDVFGITGRFSGSTVATLDPIIDISLLPIPYAYPDVLGTYEANYLYTLTAFNTVENQELLTRDFKVTVDGADEFLVPAITSFPTWGTVITPPNAPVSYYSTDTDSAVVVKMLSTSGAVFGSAASEDAMINNHNINLAVIGGEMFQFQTVTDNGDGTHTLTNLVRAKFGTDPYTFGHTAGERFVLIGDNAGNLDYDSFRTLTLPFGEGPSKVINAKLVSNNPFQRPGLQRALSVNLRPWSVSAIEASYDGSDNANFSWQYRARYGGQFVDDGAEGVLFTDGAAEEYTLYLTTNFATFRPDDATTYLRKETVTTASYQYTAANQTADGFDNTADNLYILVYVSTSVTGQETGVMNAKLLEPL